MLKKKLPDLTHLSFRNGTSAGLAKWNQTLKKKQQDNHQIVAEII